MKKRMMALFLVIAMLLSTSAFAAGLGESEAEVTATYVEGNDESSIVYSVDITWDELDFTYYEASAPVWDPVNHEYVNAGQAEGWAENDAAEIELVNHSNTDILASFSYSANVGYESATMNFTSAQTYIGSAENGYEKTATNTVTPSGTLPVGTENAVIGYITIQIAACPDVGPRKVQEDETEWTSDVDYEIDDKNALIVSSSNEVSFGRYYVLESEYTAIQELLDDCNYAAYEFMEGLISQSELNEIYYHTLAEKEFFINNKIYIKD